jgi:hypothetical protein
MFVMTKIGKRKDTIGIRIGDKNTRERLKRIAMLKRCS